MSAGALRWLERAHGVAAWLAVAVLAIALALPLLRRSDPARASLWPPVLATLLVTGAFAAGIALDLPYRGLLRQRVFVDSTALGWLFERKTHLAFGALALAWCGLALHAAARRAGHHNGHNGKERGRPGGSAEAAPDHAPRSAGRPDLARAARLLFAASAVFALVASIFSTLVAMRHRF